MLAESRQKGMASAAAVVLGHLGDRLGYISKERKGIRLANIKSTFEGIRSDIQNSVSRHSLGLVFFC